MNFSLILLFIIGACFGSFSSVVYYRLKNKKSGIINGRSECLSCGTRLKWYDLFPLFSWLSTGGKCRYCKSHISILYPLLEISFGILFVIAGSFFI